MKSSSSATGRTAPSSPPLAAGGRAFPLSGLLLLLLLVPVVAAYLPAIDAPFLFDDHVNIANNPAVTAGRTVADALSAAFSPYNPSATRPLANVSFALNAVWAGMRPASFRWVNIALLCLSGAALFLLSLALCRATGLASRAVPVAAAATVFWVANPLHTNDVSYVVQRMALAANLLSMLSLALYLLGRGRGRAVTLAASGVAFLGALGFKETAAIVPLAVLLLEVTVFGALHPPRRRRLLTALLLAGLAAFLLLAGWRYADVYASRGFTLGQRLLTEPRVVLLSLSLFLLPLPARLSIDHDVAVSTSLLAPPTTALALAVIGALLAGAILLRRRHPFATTCVLLFLLHLVIEFTVIPLELMFEHRILLPTAFLTLALAAGAVAALDRLVPPGRARSAVGAVALAVLCLALAAGTRVRNRVWGSEVALWEDAARKSPAKARVWNNLGLSYDLAGRKADAERSFRESIARDAGYAEPRTNLALLYESAGRPDEALSVLREAAAAPLRGYPGYRAFNAALLQELSGRREEAIAAYRQAVPLFPGHPEVYARLARLLNNARRFGEALDAASAGRAIGPTDPFLLHESGRALHGLDRKDEAKAAYAANIAANPSFAASRFNLGVLCYSLGETECARENLSRFLSLAPGDPGTGVARGILALIPPAVR